MGASERDRQTLPEPRPVWWHWNNWIGGKIPPQPPHPAILLEWRAVEREGRPTRWEGLIVYATGGGERGWNIQLTWVAANELRPNGPD